MKPWIKKTLIITVTSLFLGAISLFEHKSNNDYYFAKDHNLTQKTQKIFWSHADDISIKKAGVGFFYSSGDGFHDGQNSKYFSLKLNDQWDAKYNYDQQNGEYIFRITLYRPGESAGKGFTFYVNPNNLTVIKDDQKYRINTYLVSPEERKRIDAETTPDSITDTDYLEKLALKKFVEFQDEYFKVNGK